MVYRRGPRCSDSGHFPAILHTQHCGSQPREQNHYGEITFICCFGYEYSNVAGGGEDIGSGKRDQPKK